MGKLEVVRERLAEFYSLAKEVVHNTCHAALLATGFVADDNDNFKSHTKKLACKKSKDVVKMSCIEQANTRRFYILLSR
jgi:hypothetical protein